MVIVVKLKKWVPIDGIEHITTSWYVATDIEFTNIVTTVENSDMLEMYYEDITIPVGSTYYVKAMRHFNDGSVDYWSEIVPVSNIEDQYSTMLLATDTIVDEPTIYCNREHMVSDGCINSIIDIDVNNIILETSKYRGTNDGHLYTHWFILDESNKLIYTNLKNNINKTSLTLDKRTIDYNNRSNITIKAIHESSNGIISGIGTLTINKYDINFVVEQDIESVIPYNNLSISFRAIDITKDTGITLVNLLYYGNIKTLLSINNVYTIPWYILEEGVELQLEVVCKDNIGNMIKVYKDVKTIRNTSGYIRNENKVYTLDTINGITDSIKLSPYVTSESLINNTIPVPTIDNINMSSVDNSLELVSGLDMSVLTNNNAGTYIKVFNKNMILVDTLNSDNKPTFLLYRYIPNSNSFTLLQTLVRDMESKPLGYTNGIILINSKEFIYNPVDTNRLVKYSIITNEIVELKSIPLANTKYCIIRIEDNKLLIIINGSYNTYVYNIINDTYVDGISITSPVYSVVTELKTVELANGDTILYQTADDTDKTIMLYKHNTQDFISIELDHSLCGKDSVVLDQEGNVIFYKLIDDLFVEGDEYVEYIKLT